MMTCRSYVRLLAILAIVWAGGGCVGVPAGPAMRPARNSTFLIHMPGVAGDTIFDHWWLLALKEGGAAGRVELFDWTCRDPWIDALQAYGRNHDQARRVADKIAAHVRAAPRAGAIVTAESGGAGIAVWALEDLPGGVMVDDVVLIAPALSPAYDLSAALRHVRHRVYYFSSPGDWFILGWGTRVYGTIDGQHTDAAGLVGFHPPVTADPAQYRKLVEVKYDPGWWRYGNFGSHAGGMSSTFAREVLAPLLRRDSAPSTRTTP